MGKLQLYEAIQDERNKPKPAVKPIEQWDATELRRAMLADAKAIRSDSSARKLRHLNPNDRSLEDRSTEMLEAMREIGRPCTKHDIADAMGLSPHTAYSHMKPLVMADIVTTDREHNKAPIVYALVEGYDGQSSLDI